MGRGDKKTKKGKLTIGSYGVTRPRATAKATPPKTEVKPAKVKTETVAKAKTAAPKAKAKAKSKSKDSE
ncbi:MAG: 30S ribosomal protein THX [Bacteroidota bacterium]|nr:30S ribosomal protein THX [Bacteroidota bacterium]